MKIKENENEHVRCPKCGSELRVIYTYVEGTFEECVKCKRIWNFDYVIDTLEEDLHPEEIPRDRLDESVASAEEYSQWLKGMARRYLKS